MYYLSNITYYYIVCTLFLSSSVPTNMFIIFTYHPELCWYLMLFLYKHPTALSDVRGPVAHCFVMHVSLPYFFGVDVIPRLFIFETCYVYHILLSERHTVTLAFDVIALLVVLFSEAV